MQINCLYSFCTSIHMYKHTNSQTAYKNNFFFPIFREVIFIKILRSVFSPSLPHILHTCKSEISKGFLFMQVLHMFHDINFLFCSIFTVRALKHCRFATFITSMSPQGAVSKVNFPTVVALVDSFLACC